MFQIQLHTVYKLRTFDIILDSAVIEQTASLVGSSTMDPREVEFTSLVGWLRTFALQSEVMSGNKIIIKTMLKKSRVTIIANWR